MVALQHEPCHLHVHLIDGQAYPITQSNGDFDEAAGAESIAQSNGDFDEAAGASSYRPSPGAIKVSLCITARCSASVTAELPKSVMKGQALQLEAFLTKSPAALTSIERLLK